MYSKLCTKIERVIDAIVLSSNTENLVHDVNLGTLASITSGKRPIISKGGMYEIIGANGKTGMTDSWNVRPESIITGRVGTIGKFHRVESFSWASDNSLVISSKYHTYLLSYLRQNFLTASIVKGSTQPLVTQTDLSQTTIKVPTNIEDVENRLEKLDSAIMYIHKKQNAALEIKNLLLSKYF